MNNNLVLKKLEPQTERDYQRKLDLWDRYVASFKSLDLAYVKIDSPKRIRVLLHTTWSR